MKRTLFFLSFILCISAVRADILLIEDFDYPNGDLLTDHGWLTPWGDAGELTTTSGLTFEGYAGCEIGNAVAIDVKTSQPLHKQLSQTVSQGDIYVSFILQTHWSTDHAYFMALRGDNLTTNFDMNARVYLNEDNQVGLSFGKDKTSAVYADKELRQGYTYLIVAKYHIVEGQNNDEVSLYLLQEMTDEEPTVPTIGPLTDKSKADIKPSYLQLRGDNSDSYFVVDGIRVATTWQEAVAAGTCPEGAQLYMDIEPEIEDPAEPTDEPTDEPTTEEPTTEEPTEDGLQEIIAEMGEVEIYDILGTKIGSYTSTPQLPQGLYIIRSANTTRKIRL